MEIRLLIDQTPGTMARVLALCRRSGLDSTNHHIEKSGDPAYSELTVDAGGVISNDVAQALRDIRGVVRVIHLGAHGDVSNARRSIPVTPGVLRGNIVDKIISAYPRIFPYLNAYEKEINDSGERGRRVRTLGEQVGLRMARGTTEFDACNETGEVLNLIAQSLQPLAQCTAREDAVHVSVSVFTRRRTDMMELSEAGNGGKCFFLAGLIQGMLNAAPMLPIMSVEETKCRINGDKECIFHVSV